MGHSGAGQRSRGHVASLLRPTPREDKVRPQGLRVARPVRCIRFGRRPDLAARGGGHRALGRSKGPLEHGTAARGRPLAADGRVAFWTESRARGRDDYGAALALGGSGLPRARHRRGEHESDGRDVRDEDRVASRARRARRRPFGSRSPGAGTSAGALRTVSPVAVPKKTTNPSRAHPPTFPHLSSRSERIGRYPRRPSSILGDHA